MYEKVSLITTSAIVVLTDGADRPSPRSLRGSACALIMTSIRDRGSKLPPASHPRSGQSLP